MRRIPIALLAFPIGLALFEACHDDPLAIKAAALSSGSAAASSGAGGHGGAGASSVAVASTGVVVTVGTGAGGDDGGMHWCDMPGSIRFTEQGKVVVPGGPAGMPDLGFITLPQNFCIHWYGNVGNSRQLRFAPNGDLFVASPTTGTTSGGKNGEAAIILLPQDQNGVAAAPIVYASNLPSTQGLLFANDGYFYYQDHTKIMRVPYKIGDHAPSGPSEQVVDISVANGEYTSSGHWPKTLDQADDGTIYVGNGGDEGETCDPTHPFHGGILKIDGSPGGAEVAKGFRNPIGVRCQKGHNHCFAAELAKDYSNNGGGREKLIPIHQGDDWGYPCCATKDLPYPGQTPVPVCSAVTADTDSFTIGDTPFGVDFEPGNWPAPFTRSAIVPLHGSFGSWYHAKVIAIATDPATGSLLPATNLLDGGPSGAMIDFAIGWDDGTLTHGRPTAIAFAPDGRLFLSNDQNGDIVWIAPLSL